MNNKRSHWIGFCMMWAVFWFVLGIVFIPFWLMVPFSLVMILAPVGVSDNPSDYRPRHNPDEWNKR